MVEILLQRKHVDVIFGGLEKHNDVQNAGSKPTVCDVHNLHA